MEEANILNEIVATKTNIAGLDYRTITSNPVEPDTSVDVTGGIAEGTEIPEVSIKTQDNLIKLNKRGRMLVSSYVYYLALMTYDMCPPEFIPTLKKAMICLRLAWLCNDINLQCHGYNYDTVSQMFYRKALFFYQQAIINETNRTEKSSALANMGPDMDKNYGWDGVIYLCGLLEYKYGQQEDIQLRLKKLNESKVAIARIFGLGKSSKSKPGPLLEHARELYDNISKLVADDEF
ncbi:MAG: DUF2225 domain-containing protein [Treponema sp.]|nr:DUF2225 domain-containing protein [Treponema sp.]